MPFLILGASLALLAVCFLGILRWCYGKAFYFSNKKKKTDLRTYLAQTEDSAFYKTSMVSLAEKLDRTPFEPVTIVSRDGLTLYGRFYRFTERNCVEILFHGWRSNALRDASGGAQMARDNGYNLLLVDQRAHGKSDGNTITFGILEKYDCLDWVAYTVDRFGADVKILLGGVSMGASTVLMASALPLPENVKAITADCGYTSPEAIIRKVCRDMGIPDRLGYPFVRMSARVFGGFSLRDGGAVEAVRTARVPIMIMHGEEDDFVPFSMCGEIFDACAAPEKELLTIPRAGHGTAYFYDTERYAGTVGAFKRRALGIDAESADGSAR